MSLGNFSIMRIEKQFKDILEYRDLLNIFHFRF